MAFSLARADSSLNTMPASFWREMLPSQWRMSLPKAATIARQPSVPGRYTW